MSMVTPFPSQGIIPGTQTIGHTEWCFLKWSSKCQSIKTLRALTEPVGIYWPNFQCIFIQQGKQSFFSSTAFRVIFQLLKMEVKNLWITGFYGSSAVRYLKSNVIYFFLIKKTPHYISPFGNLTCILGKCDSRMNQLSRNNIPHISNCTGLNN